MRVIQHPSNTSVRAAPKGHTIEECRPAPVTVVHYGNGIYATSTFWELTDSERAMIASGALVELMVDGPTMLPSKLSVVERP